MAPEARKRLKASSRKAQPAGAVANNFGMRERIFLVSVKLFAEKGFNGTAVRDLARALGIEVASLYYHFPSKQDLLLALLERIMDDLLEALRVAMHEAAGPTERLCRVMRSHVLFHVLKRKDALVSHSELRSLTPANRRLIIAKRDRYEMAIRSLLEEGVAAGDFHIGDVRLTGIALLAMCSGVSDWIKPRGRLHDNEVAELYGVMALQLVGAQARGEEPANRAIRGGATRASRSVKERAPQSAAPLHFDRAAR